MRNFINLILDIVETTILGAKLYLGAGKLRLVASSEADDLEFHREMLDIALLPVKICVIGAVICSIAVATIYWTLKMGKAIYLLFYPVLENLGSYLFGPAYPGIDELSMAAAALIAIVGTYWTLSLFNSVIRGIHACYLRGKAVRQPQYRPAENDE